jgi:hypothetical protein
MRTERRAGVAIFGHVPLLSRELRPEDHHMATLFDMLAGAQGGRGMDLLAKQFNISQQQAELAVEALLPAFSQGLKRNASNPADLGGFLSALSSGQHAKYFQDAANAFQPAGVQDGNGILGHLFGSKDVSRAVAAQAAQATGLQQDMLKQMLPALASMIMGGLFSQATGQGQPQRAQAAASNNPLGQILEQMMGGGMGGPMGGSPRPSAPQPGADNPFGKMLEGMFGGGGGAAPQPTPQSAPVDSPFGKMFEDMMRGGGQATSRTPEPEPEEEKQSAKGKAKAAPKAAPSQKANPSSRARTPYDELFGEMFETGRKTQDSYQQGVESVFDQFLKGMNRNR